MEQMWFLSIVINIFTGLVIIADSFSEKYEFFKKLESIFKNVGFRLLLALITIIVGVIKLVWTFNGIPVIGDFFPALAGITLAVIIILDYLNSKNETPTESMQIVNGLLLKNKLIFGLGAIVISILHFLIPGVFLF